MTAAISPESESLFGPRLSVLQVEEGHELSPKFDAQVQKVAEMRIDDDQDCVWLRVDMKGCASCHVGYASCFYRKVPVGEQRAQGTTLEFTEREKKFDPQAVYGDAPNPTQL